MSDPDLTQAWREASHDEPPLALDDAIRAAARRAVHARPRPAGGSPFGGRWRVPLSVAALLVVSATVTLLVAERDKQGPGALHDQALPSPAARVPQAPTGELNPELSQAPARQFEERSAPLQPTDVAPRDRESKRGPSAAQAERDTMPPPPLPSSDEKLQARAQSADELARPMPAEEAAKTKADQPESQRAEDQPRVPTSVVPAPSVAPPTGRSDYSLREALPAPAGAPAGDLAVRGDQATAKAERPAAAATPAAPPPAQVTPQRTQQEAAPRAKARTSRAPQTSPEVTGPAEAQNLEPPNLEPGAWLDRIVELRRQGKLEEADKSLKAFRERYPAYPLPPELKSSP